MKYQEGGIVKSLNPDHETGFLVPRKYAEGKDLVINLDNDPEMRERLNRIVNNHLYRTNSGVGIYSFTLGGNHER